VIASYLRVLFEMQVIPWFCLHSVAKPRYAKQEDGRRQVGLGNATATSAVSFERKLSR
jgi:hypothetical protein